MLKTLSFSRFLDFSPCSEDFDFFTFLSTSPPVLKTLSLSEKLYKDFSFTGDFEFFDLTRV